MREAKAWARVERSVCSSSPPSGTGQPGDPHAAAPGHLRDVMRRGLALDGGVGGQDHLAYRVLGEALFQQVQPQVRRSDAVQR